MKIDIEELPTIIDALNLLSIETQRLKYLQAKAADAYTVGNAEGGRYFQVSREEVTSILQARIEAETKRLAQRYQIDFTRLSAFLAQAPACKEPEA